jgi:hypothetical protein
MVNAQRRRLILFEAAISSIQRLVRRYLQRRRIRKCVRKLLEEACEARKRSSGAMVSPKTRALLQRCCKLLQQRHGRTAHSIFFTLSLPNRSTYKETLLSMIEQLYASKVSILVI